VEAHLGGRASWAVEADPEEVETRPGTVDDQLWAVEAHSDTGMAPLLTCLKLTCSSGDSPIFAYLQKVIQHALAGNGKILTANANIPLVKYFATLSLNTFFH
jgi:hypothetical protein